MEDFDPASLGAVAVDDYKQNTFDPSSLGAVAVEEFDPRSLGAEEVNDPRMSGVDEVSVAQGSEPTSNVFADLGRRLGAGTAESGLDTAAGLLKYESDVSGLGKKFNELGPFGNLKTLLSSALKGIKSKMDTDGSSVVDKSLRALDSTPSEMFMGAAQEMRDLSERSKSDYKVDPKRDQDFASKVASGAGSLIPVIAAGPAAPVAMAGMMGESGRKDAEQSGATKAQQDVSFYANAAVGAISEGIMGMPALLRSIKAGKITEGAAKEMATSIATQAVKSYAREGSQEAIEQAAGNAVAKWVAAYDPEREITEGVKESFLVGGAIGAPTGALFQAAENFSTPKKIEEAVETETAADVVDESLRETALSTPPPPVTPQSTEAPVVTLPSGSTIVMNPPEVKSEQTPDAVWTQLSDDEREGLQVRLEALLEKKGSVEWSDIPVDLQNKIGTSEAHGIKGALKSDPEKAIADLVKAAPPTTNPPSEVPEQQESPTPQEPPKVLAPDERAKILQPFVKEAERVAESMGATDPEQAASKAWADLSKSDLPLDNPRSLLLKFASGNARDQLKASQAKSRGGGNVVSMEGQDIENAAVETKGPRQETVEKEDLEQLKKAIGTFTPTEKKVGMMLADEMTVEEIAEELDMAVGSVKNIRTRLAQELGPYAQRMGYGKSLGPGAASADEDLVKYSMRKFAERFQEDESIHEDIRNQSGENYYEPIPFVQTGKEAGKIIEEMGEDKVANQITDPSSDITFAQRVVIGIELLTRLNDRYRKERDADPIAAAQTLEKAIAVNEWLKQYGTSLGQGVANFKQWGKRLKLHRMIALMQAANGGAPLSNEQIDFINEIEKTETETEERLDARITALEEEASQSHADLTLSDRIKENIQEKTDPLVLSIAERIGKWLKTKEDAARKRLRERVKYLGSNPDPLIAADLAIIGASKLYNGILSKVKWMQAMRADEDLSGMGEELEQYLEPAWEDANKLLDDKVEDEAPKAKREPVKRIVKKMSTEEVREELTKRITREAKEGGKLEDMVPLIRRLADAFIASGIRTRDPLVDALHAVIEPILPGTTKREVRDAFSGYGRFRELSKDDVSQVRRDLSAQSQLVSKYEDIKSGQPLKKSGVERTPTSDEQRRLSKLVEEAKRVHGVKVTDPARQLKSAQDAIKTRLKNEIKDMARQIETGEKPPGKSQTEWDAEIERLKAQRDRMKDVLSSLEDTKIPEETRIKNAERALEKSIEEIQRRIKNKETKTTKGTPLESEKLSVLRAQKEVLLAELDELRSADTALQEERAFDALMKRKDQLEKQIASGDLFPATKEKPEDTELVKEAREIVNELQKQLADARRSSPESRKAQLDKAIASVESSIKALDARLQAGDLSTKESSPEVTTPELERLRAERAAMVKELNRQRREAAKPSESEAQARKDAKQIENLEKSIAALTQKINAKDLSTKPRKPLSTPEAQKLADYKKYLNDFLNDMRRAAKPKLTAEEVAMKAFKTRTAKKIKELEDRIARGDFAKRAPKKIDISKDPEAKRLAGEMVRIRKEFQKRVMLEERKNRTKLEKAAYGAAEVVNLSRNIMASGDVSAVMRQGGMFTTSHPVMAAKNLGPMFQSFKSEQAFNEVQGSIEKRDNWTNGYYKDSGLYLAETGDVKLTQKEEAYMSELGDKIPFIKGSNRAYVAYLNLMRADMFDLMTAQAEAMGEANEESRKVIANYVNVASGRGNVKGMDGAAQAASFLLFSPRLWLSRIQLLLGQPLWGEGIHKNIKSTYKTRLLVAKEYSRAWGAIAAFSALAAMAGAEWEDDPTSSDFMKLKFGNTRVDPWMGLLQPLVLAARNGYGTIKKSDGKGGYKIVPIKESAGKVPFGQDRVSDLLFKHVRSKAAPIPGMILNLSSEENVLGEKDLKAFKRSDWEIPFTDIKGISGEVPKAYLPLILSDLPEIMAEHGYTKGAIFSALSALGLGVQHYDQRDNPKQLALEIMASPR